MAPKFWLNPPRGGGIRWVPPTMNCHPAFEYANRVPRWMTFPNNTPTDYHCDPDFITLLNYEKGLIQHEFSLYNYNVSAVLGGPFSLKFWRIMYYQNIHYDRHYLPFFIFMWCVLAAGMRSYDNSAYDFYYFTD